MKKAVLDASALLAFLFDEPGAGEVERRLAEGALISAVNLCEVLSKLAIKGVAVDKAIEQFISSGLFEALEIVDFDEIMAKEAARIMPECRKAGLSLGDRTCLSLAGSRNAVAVTADSRWVGFPWVEVELIR